MTPASNPINALTQELKTCSDDMRLNRFETLNDMTDRPKRVFRKTPLPSSRTRPPPPTIRGVSTSASHDEFLDEHNPEPVSADFIRAVMRAVEVISAENGFRPQHPPASHEEFLARRRAQRPPRQLAQDNEHQLVPQDDNDSSVRRNRFEPVSDMFEPLSDTTDRPKRVFRKTPTPSSRKTPVAGRETRV
ncbi:hypothetical protein T484DRAFT_1751212 [Baffinella frigidus]|nr:hypothetical protein T484DRAFT_1751212 [Cryptophyta sp. CCMP2293]